MAKKEFRGNGKGKGPIAGYNHKNWNANYGEISWADSFPKMERKLRRNRNHRNIYVYGDNT